MHLFIKSVVLLNPTNFIGLLRLHAALIIALSLRQFYIKTQLFQQSFLYPLYSVTHFDVILWSSRTLLRIDDYAVNFTIITTYLPNGTLSNKLSSISFLLGFFAGTLILITFTITS